MIFDLEMIFDLKTDLIWTRMRTRVSDLAEKASPVSDCQSIMAFFSSFFSPRLGPRFSQLSGVLAEC